MWASGARSPRGAHAALRRHHGRHAAIEQLAEAFGDQRPDAREALGQHIGADQHHGAHHLARQRFAHADAVRADHVALELIQVLARDAHIGEHAHARIHRVDGCFAGGQPVDERARLFHRGAGVRSEFDLRGTRLRDGARVGYGEPMAIDREGHRAILAARWKALRLGKTGGGNAGRRQGWLGSRREQRGATGVDHHLMRKLLSNPRDAGKRVVSHSTRRTPRRGGHAEKDQCNVRWCSGP